MNRFGTKARVGVAVMALLTVYSSKGYAMGDFESIARGFWTDLVASYWWPNLHAMNDDHYPRTYDEQATAILVGESTPVGLITSQQTVTPPNPANVTCEDFSVVRINEISPTDNKRLPFRVHHP